LLKKGYPGAIGNAGLESDRPNSMGKKSKKTGRKAVVIYMLFAPFFQPWSNQQRCLEFYRKMLREYIKAGGGYFEHLL